MPHDARPAPASIELGETSGGCGGHCTCGASAAAVPVLDVRSLPPAIRHDAVLGSLSGLPSGGSLVLAAPHAPLPLLAELEGRHPGEFSVAYDESGPETWLVRLTRA